METLNQPTYPMYFRKKGKCMKVISETQANVIVLPPDSVVAERFTTVYPSVERMQEETSKMDLTDLEAYKNFLCTFYQSVHQEREANAKALGEKPTNSKVYARED